MDKRKILKDIINGRATIDALRPQHGCIWIELDDKPGYFRNGAGTVLTMPEIENIPISSFSAQVFVI